MHEREGVIHQADCMAFIHADLISADLPLLTVIVVDEPV